MDVYPKYQLIIYLDAARELYDGEGHFVNLVRVSTGYETFKTINQRAKEVKEALTRLVFKFSAELFKLNSAISLEAVKLRDEILESCL